MNLLEHYIREIHEVREVKTDWGSYIFADLTISCYRDDERVQTSFPNWESWEEAKEKGYYLA